VWRGPHRLAAQAALLLAAVLNLPLPACAQAAEYLNPDQRQQDLDALCRFVASDYAYLDIKATDWPRACQQLRPLARPPMQRDAYVALLERVVGQLYDPHAHLATHQANSPRLVPTQTTLVAQWQGSHAVVVAVRAGGPAAAAGVMVGDRILAVNGLSVAEAAAIFEPQFMQRADPAARHWALQVALAGRQDQSEVQLDLQEAHGVRRVRYAPHFATHEARLTAMLQGGIGHVRIHNTLGDDALVADFDAALLHLAEARALVLDLRDTPSGGHTGVARGLMGRLVQGVRPYQRHERVSEYRQRGVRRVWVEYVSERGSVFKGPVVVLVGRWTGSMGEGLAIGLHAARGAPVLGQPMAGLQGALGEYKLPHSGISVRVPVERLFHVDGTPRELFLPQALPVPGAAGRVPRLPPDAAMDATADTELQAAREWAKRLLRAAPPAPQASAPRRRG
jgi:carboxyl-terminal processing protease